MSGHDRGWYLDGTTGQYFFWGGTQWASLRGQYLTMPAQVGDVAYRPGPVPKKFGDGIAPVPGQPIPPVSPGESSSGELVPTSAQPLPIGGDANVQIAATQTRYVLKQLSPKEEAVLAEHAPQGERPWLVINPGAGAGFLAAFDRELIIAKTSLTAGFMAGSLGGRRVTTFPYTQITGIEYNAGMMSGVLEILTPSYQGSANKDYWKGTGLNPNKDTNNPFTLSNTLPLMKPEFKQAAADIAELRQRVHAAHQVTVVIPAATAPAAPTPATGLAAELQQLAELHSAGVLSEEEFAQAKAKLLARD